MTVSDTLLRISGDLSTYRAPSLELFDDQRLLCQISALVRSLYTQDAEGTMHLNQAVLDELTKGIRYD